MTNSSVDQKLGEDALLFMAAVFRHIYIVVLFNTYPAARLQSEAGRTVILELHVLVELFRQWRIHRVLRLYRS